MGVAASATGVRGITLKSAWESSKVVGLVDEATEATVVPTVRITSISGIVKVVGSWMMEGVSIEEPDRIREVALILIEERFKS